MSNNKKVKIVVGQTVQINPNANTKNAGKFGTVKTIRTNSCRWSSSEPIYVIDLGENKTAEVMADKLLFVTEATEQPTEKLEERFFVISTDGMFTSKPMGYAKAVETAKQMQMLTPDAPNYYIAKVVQKTTTPKTVVDMVSI